MDELTQLADLHSRGALTDEEFSATKRRLLGG
ncbi:MAG: SHOCT domain-containing protein [Solirubrobacteraceae bacterium]